jgi:hypothetical protein
MTDYSILSHTVAPSGVTNTWVADAAQYRFGTKITAVNLEGEITAVAVYVPDTSWAGVASEVYVRRSEGPTETDSVAPYRTQAFVGRATPGWQIVELDTPYPLAIGETVTVAYKRVTGMSYVTKADMILTDLFSADEAIKAPESVWNGVYSTSINANDPIRTVYYDGTWYGVDVVYTVSVPLDVSAGPDQEPEVGDPINLIATASGGAGAISYLWEKLSGPSATFGTPNAGATTFVPSVAGSYVLKVTATSGSETISDTINVNVWTPIPPGGQIPPTVFRYSGTSWVPQEVTIL